MSVPIRGGRSLEHALDILRSACMRAILRVLQDHDAKRRCCIVNNCSVCTRSLTTPEDVYSTEDKPQFALGFGLLFEAEMRGGEEEGHMMIVIKPKPMSVQKGCLFCCLDPTEGS